MPPARRRAGIAACTCHRNTMLADPTHMPNHDVVIHTLSNGPVGLGQNWFSDILEDDKHVSGGDITRDKRKLRRRRG